MARTGQQLAMTDTPLKLGSDIAKAWWSFVVVVFAIASAWFSLNNRVSAVEQSNQSVQDDVKWLRSNVYNMLIKQGIPPVNP